MKNKTRTHEFVLLIALGLFCIGLGIVVFGMSDVNSVRAYTETEEFQIVELDWNGTYSSAYGESVSTDIIATFEGKPDSVIIEIEGLSNLSAESDAGTYILTAKSSDSTYVFSNPSIVYTITPKEVEVVWNGIFESEYGSAIENITATFDGISATITGRPTSGTGVGSYILTATTDNKNYTLTNATHSYVIKPKEVEVVWNGIFESEYGSAIENITATFDGISATITGRPTSGSGVGSYILTATTNNVNYKLLGATRLYTIKAATINIHEVTLIWNANRTSEYGSSIADVSVTFEGKPDSVIIEIEGLSNLSAESDAGTYILTAKSSDSTYVFSNPSIVYTITPKELEVVWSGIFESKYGSEIETVTATSKDELKDAYITIYGLEQLNSYTKVGTYILTARVDNSNYKLTNETAAYTVLDVAAETQLANSSTIKIVLAVILAIVILGGGGWIAWLILKRKESEKRHFDTENALRQSYEKLKNQNDRILRERRAETFRPPVTRVSPTQVATPIRTIKSECEPTWKDIYTFANDLGRVSTVDNGEHPLEFQEYANQVAQKIKEGILAHGDKMLIIEGVTIFDPTYHIQVNGEDEPVLGTVIRKVIKQGITINGYVVVKAEIIR